MGRPWGVPEWRRAFLGTLAVGYGLALLAAFLWIPGTDVPWLRNGIYFPGAGPRLLDYSWRTASMARDILPWLAYPLVVWGILGRLGVLDRWIKPLTGVHLLLILWALLLGAAGGAGYALARSSGIPMGEFPD